jgi:hypothetical protein
MAGCGSATSSPGHQTTIQGPASVRAAINRTLGASSLEATTTLSLTGSGPAGTVKETYHRPDRIMTFLGTVPPQTVIRIGFTEYQDRAAAAAPGPFPTVTAAPKRAWVAQLSPGGTTAAIALLFEPLVCASHSTISGTGPTYAFTPDPTIESCATFDGGSLRVEGGWVVEVSHCDQTGCSSTSPPPSVPGGTPPPGITTVSYSAFNAAPPVTTPPRADTTQMPCSPCIQ